MKNCHMTSVATLFIRNLPPDTTEEILRNRFDQYGEVLQIRIPTTENGGCRGFGFVDYATNDEAQKAIYEGNKTELNGNLIVVERSRYGLGDTRRSRPVQGQYPPRRTLYDDIAPHRYRDEPIPHRIIKDSAPVRIRRDDSPTLHRYRDESPPSRRYRDFSPSRRYRDEDIIRYREDPGYIEETTRRPIGAREYYVPRREEIITTRRYREESPIRVREEIPIRRYREEVIPRRIPDESPPRRLIEEIPQRRIRVDSPPRGIVEEYPADRRIVYETTNPPVWVRDDSPPRRPVTETVARNITVPEIDELSPPPISSRHKYSDSD